MSVPRWIVVPSGSVSTAGVVSTRGRSVCRPKMEAAIALSGRLTQAVIFSSRFMEWVASSAVTSSVEPPPSA